MTSTLPGIVPSIMKIQNTRNTNDNFLNIKGAPPSPAGTSHNTPLQGFFNINKPGGWTSHDVVAKIRTLLSIQKVGHAGTLDPMATGVLPICVGKGTKIVEYLLESDKEYRAVLRLGEETDTLDATGKILRRSDQHVTEDELRSALAGFIGRIEQTPPMYSAVKVQGVPLYKAARAGQKLSAPPRSVTIRSLEILSFENRDATFNVVCSKGTYIRSLCSDIGNRIGCGAHLLRLERRQAGTFRIEDAISISELEDLIASGKVESRLYSLDRVLSGFPIVQAGDQAAIKCSQGVPLSRRGILDLPENFGRQALVRIHDPAARLIAIGRAAMDRGEAENDPDKHWIKIEKVLI
jgi:tRNA pseudouridine55 synthase